LQQEQQQQHQLRQQRRHSDSVATAVSCRIIDSSALPEMDYCVRLSLLVKAVFVSFYAYYGTAGNAGV